MDRLVDKIAAASAPASDLPAPGPRPVPALRIPVDFSAPDSGIGELTWGQMEIWLGMTRQGWLHLGGMKPLPAGTTLLEIVDELRYLMTRYPSMRTRLRFDARQRPTQQLFNSGEITLEVFDTGYMCPSEADKFDADVVTTCPSEADETAAAVLADYDATSRDFAGEWPVRMAVVRHRGELTHMVVLMCHLVTDGVGAQVMLREVAVRERAPVTGPQQLELARWQCSEAGQRHNAAALRHWEKILRSLPRTPYPVSDDWREPRHWSGEYSSPALYLAVPEIAERTQTDSSSVLMALYAIALGRRGVLNPAVIRPLVHNRFRSRLTDVVCTLVQSGISVLDVTDLTVDEAVRRARRASMSANKFAYFDPEQMAELFERVARERGPQFGTTSFFNDRRAEESRARTGPPTASPTAAPITPRRLREVLANSSFRWFGKKRNPFERLFLHVDDGPESIVLTVCADTHHISPADIEGLARDMETIAVEAAFDPVAPTRVAVPILGTDVTTSGDVPGPADVTVVAHA